MRSNRLSYRPRHTEHAGDILPGASRPPDAEARALLLAFGQRDLGTADQVGTEVVDHRANGGQRDEQHDVDHADDDRAAEHQRPGHHVVGLAVA
jgi:hypothetical protein